MADNTYLDWRDAAGAPVVTRSREVVTGIHALGVVLINPDTNVPYIASGGAGGGGDASAANQLTEITALQTLAARGTAVPTTSFTRPADTTAYAANSTTAASIVPMSFTVARVAAGGGMIRRCRLRKSGTGITNALFRLHLYKASPVPTNGDNGAWLTDQAANYVGAMDITFDRVFSDGAAGNGVPLSGSELNFKLASGQIVYGILEARGVYTPASAEVFTVTLEVLQD